jgi:XTP/dITP diphosphohydrolase
LADSGSPAGARLLDVVRIIDVLVGPGGDAWRREQTHASLAKYLLEEAYEAYDAIVGDDQQALKEELGDVLLQVVLHARMAQEAGEGWDIDDVAQALADKLVRRNPHVFAGLAVADVAEITANWERIKREEKSRASVLDGVPFAQPALALAAKVLARARSAAIAVPVAAVPDPPADEEALGEQLLALVADGAGRGLDAEAALRRAIQRRVAAVQAEEAVRRTATDG